MRLKKPCLSNVCEEVKIALFLGPLMLLASFLMTGCSLWSDDTLPPRPDNGLAGAEGHLDKLTEKRLSRVSAAITVAADEDEAKSNSVIKGELEVAKSMIGEPLKADLEWAKARADKDSPEYYAAQVKDSDALLQSIRDANKKYEEEKAKQEAEYKSQLAAKELELKALQESKDAEKWTWTGIGLFAFGLSIAFLAPSARMKLAGGGLVIGGIIASSVPTIIKQPWFNYAIGGTVVFVGLAGVGYLIWNARKSKGTNGANDATDTPSV